MLRAAFLKTPARQAGDAAGPEAAAGPKAAAGEGSSRRAGVRSSASRWGTRKPSRRTNRHCFEPRAAEGVIANTGHGKNRRSPAGSPRRTVGRAAHSARTSPRVTLHTQVRQKSPDAVCVKGTLNDGNVPVRGVSLQGPPAAGDRGTTPVDRCAGRRMGPGSRWGALEQDLRQSEAAELKGGAAIPSCGVRAGRERPRRGPARNAVRMRSHTPCSCGVPRATSAGPLCRASTGRSPQPQVVCGS